MQQSTQRIHRDPANNQNMLHRSSGKRTGASFFNTTAEQPFFPRPRPIGGSPVQPKLTVNAPDDIYEKEADRVADQVMRMPDPQIQRQEEEEEMLQMKEQEHILAIQRKCAACEAEESSSLQRQTMEEEEEVMMKSQPPMVQRKCAECEAEEKMQRMPLAGNITPFFQRKESGGGEVSQQTAASLQSTRGGGRALPEHTRNWMESRFGTDFGGVRVHTDSNAVQLSRDLNAQAFTHGRDIYFNRGKFAPGTSEGKRLLAHELTHVVQQGGKWTPNIQRQAAACNPCPSPPNPNIDIKIRPVAQYSNLGMGNFGSTQWAGANVPFLSIWHRERRNCNTCGPSGNSAEYDLCPRKVVIRANVPVLINRNELNRRGTNGEQWFQDCDNPFDRRFITRANAQSSMTTPQPITVSSTRIHEGYHINVSERVLGQQLSSRNDIDRVCPYNRTDIDSWKSTLETTWRNRSQAILRANPSEPSEEGNARTHECNSY